MYTANIWYQHPIPWCKITLLWFVAMICFSVTGEAQKLKWIRKNNPNYDSKKFSYGFIIGIHTTAYQVKYSDQFISPVLDTVLAVQPTWSPGFSLGFLVNFKAFDYLDVRLTPKVAFYEHRLSYEYTGRTYPPQEQLVETTLVEFPLLLKYKSERRGNIRMYMIGGISPGIEASGKKVIENIVESLEVKHYNLNLEGGFGMDLYYPLFKFSPEIRFSRGMVNLLDNTTNKYGQPLKRLNTNTITVYLIFQ